nr:fimbrillin family protein [Parabacteroides goldsteinii]
MKVNLLIRLCFLCLAGLVGCTAEVLVDELEIQADYVLLAIQRPDVAGNTQTKTTGTENLPVGATVCIAAYQRPSDALSTPVNFSVTAPTVEATYKVDADGNLNSDSPLIVNKGTYDFYAVSPARSLSIPSGSSTYQVNNLQRGEDVMTSYAQGVEVSPSQKNVTLKTFTRQCARVVIKVIPATTNTIPLKKLTATSVTLTNMSDAAASLAVGISEGITATAGNEVTFNNFLPVPSGEDTQSLGLTEATNIVLPKSAGSYTVRIQLDYQCEGDAVVQQTLQASLPSQAFKAGYSYLITLTVDNNSSELSVTVKSWDGTITITDDNMGGEEMTII